MLDACVLTVVGVVVLIIATGGGGVEVAGIRVRARSVENPVWILAGLMTLRYAVRSWSPFLGSRRWPIEKLAASGIRFVCDWIPSRLTHLFTHPVRVLLVVSFAAFLVKALLAWLSPGFFSGDDVEIHEMTVGALLGHQWPVWDLRSSFFPMVFIYPAQRLAIELGVQSPEVLVFAGRVVVGVISTAVIPLTWLIARRLSPADPRIAAFAVALVALSKLHISFGSSELPRPVSTVFVAAAFLCILRHRLVTTAAAGILLGTAAAFRFSELVFVPAALLTLRRDGYPRQAGILVATAVVTVVGITAAADAMYWGSPLSSVAAAINYTLVQGQSSRGYDPPWEYLTLIPAWSTFMFVALAAAGSARRYPETWWLWTPIVLLSLMPHKESRYLIPIIPFLSIAAARGFFRATDWIRRAQGIHGWRRWARDLFAPFLLLSVLHQIGGWALVRSNEGIRLAQYLRSTPDAGLAVQDSWRLGGAVYLWRHEPFVGVSPAQLADGDAASAALRGSHWVALRSRTARTLGDAVLPPLGFERDPSWRGEDYVLYVRRGGLKP